MSEIDPVDRAVNQFREEYAKLLNENKDSKRKIEDQSKEILQLKERSKKLDEQVLLLTGKKDCLKSKLHKEENDVKSLKKQVLQITSEKEGIKKKLQGTENDCKSLEGQVLLLTSQKEDLRKKLTDKEDDIKSLQAKVSGLTRENRDKENRLNAIGGQFKSMMEQFSHPEPQEEAIAGGPSAVELERQFGPATSEQGQSQERRSRSDGPSRKRSRRRSSSRSLSRGSGYRSPRMASPEDLKRGHSFEPSYHYQPGLPFPKSCRSCPAQFSSREEVANHECWFTDKNKFLCEICYHRFVTPSLLKEHLNGFHGIEMGQDKIECLACGAIIHYKERVRRHIISECQANVLR